MKEMWEEYIKNLKKRAETSHVYKKHQLLGLEIAEILHDRPHRSLYMKLAKHSNGDELLRLAKDVAERISVQNLGGYFMALVSQDETLSKILRKQNALPEISKKSVKNKLKKSVKKPDADRS
jgi:hypothetical protein